ncbi:MAG: DNA double-strand break repair nuclease NurA [Chloroflexi bacterium]|nr:DNA double-strand break repair nuclease NurA [Chloroflexota bacterium]
MTLDLGSIARQIRQMGAELKAAGEIQQEYVGRAVAVLLDHADDFEGLRAKIEGARTFWPVARPVEPLDARRKPERSGASYCVVATDGSQIEPDRHGPAMCCLMNVGAAVLQYGQSPKAELWSRPQLYFRDDDLHIVSNNRRFLIQGHLLTVKRSIAEANLLAELAPIRPEGLPVVGLQDGTLVLQTLEGWGIEERLRDELTERFIDCLEQLRQAGVPLASYISRPRGADVVNALRVAACPYEVANCRMHCRELVATRTEPCGWLGSVLDRFLFGRLPLAEGEHSALFLSSSAISLERYGEHKVYFFYVNVGKEIARVEVPQWVAREDSSLNLVRQVVYDQCRRGDGYPRALAEAHERAVVSAADRKVFWRLVDSVFAGQGLPASVSQKDRSKKMRGV